MFRAVLKQHHAGKRLSLAFAPVGTALFGRGRQPAQLQNALGPAVGALERSAVRHRLAKNRLVKMLGREVKIPRGELFQRPLNLVHRCPPATGATATPVHQSLLAIGIMRIPQPQEMTLAHPQQIPSLRATQTLQTMQSDCIQYTRHPNLRQHAIPPIQIGHIACYLNRTYHLLPTGHAMRVDLGAGMFENVFIG